MWLKMIYIERTANSLQNSRFWSYDDQQCICGDGCGHSNGEEN